jgi:hypothetical protein
MQRFALLLCFVVISLMSQLTFYTNVNHTFIGNGYQECKLIHNAEMLLRQIGKAIATIAAVQAVLFIVVAVMLKNDLFYSASSTT